MVPYELEGYHLSSVQKANYQTTLSKVAASQGQISVQFLTPIFIDLIESSDESVTFSSETTLVTPGVRQQMGQMLIQPQQD